MPVGQIILLALSAVGGLGIISIIPLWLMTHTFMIHRLDKVFLGKTLKGTFDDNLWMINARTGAYASLLVLHKFCWYRAFKSYPERRNKKLKGFGLLGFSALPMNTLECEDKLKDLNIWEKLFLYWLFWSLAFAFGCGGAVLFLIKVCGIPMPS